MGGKNIAKQIDLRFLPDHTSTGMSRDANTHVSYLDSKCFHSCLISFFFLVRADVRATIEGCLRVGAQISASLDSMLVYIGCLRLYLKGLVSDHQAFQHVEACQTCVTGAQVTW